MVKTKYSCAQKDLYPISRLGVKKLMTVTDLLAEFKPKYSTGFFTNFTTEINAAESLPDHAARIAKVKNLTVDIIEKRATVLNYNVKLESYIRDAFDEEKQDALFKAAGNEYWDKAKKKDASSVLGLLSAMTEFVVDYKKELMANNNMPALFVDELKAVDADFRQINSDLEDAEGLVVGSKEAKIGASNAVYTKLMNCFSDAKALNDSDREWVDQFNFTTYWNQVKSTKNAGLSGKVTTEEDPKTGLENVLITIKGSIKADETDAEGRYEINSLSADKYMVTFEAEGYESQTIEVTIKTGVTTRLNVKMKVLAAKTTTIVAA